MGWVEGQFGRKKGLARLGLSQILAWMGQYDHFRQVDLARVQRFVFVCLGNICRSPYAEARARALGLVSASFGLGATEGDRADPRATAAARRRGVELSDHRSKPYTSLSVGPEDLLVAMEPAQAERLVGLTRATAAQVTLLGLWCRPQRAHIEDPYGLSETYFQTCFDCIDRGVAHLVELRLASSAVIQTATTEASS